MKPTHPIIVLLVALACAAPAVAQHQVFKRGADLHESLQQETQSSNALNYIVGVVDATDGMPSRDGTCFDLKGATVSGSQLAQVVRSFLLKNAQMKDQPGSGLVTAALQEVWPCK